MSTLKKIPSYYFQVYIQNATLAGGVAAGTVSDMLIGPWGALCCGLLAGIISTLGFAYLTVRES